MLQFLPPEPVVFGTWTECWPDLCKSPLQPPVAFPASNFQFHRHLWKIVVKFLNLSTWIASQSKPLSDFSNVPGPDHVFLQLCPWHSCPRQSTDQQKYPNIQSFLLDCQ